MRAQYILRYHGIEPMNDHQPSLFREVYWRHRGVERGGEGPGGLHGRGRYPLEAQPRRRSILRTQD